MRTNKKKKEKKVVVCDPKEGAIGDPEDALNTTVVVIPDDSKDVPIEDDEVTVFRDVMSMTDDERFSFDDTANLNSIRLSPPPKPMWYDNPKNVKFLPGKLVVRKGSGSTVYRVSGPMREKDSYAVIPTKSQNEEVVHCDQLKAAPKDAVWVKYWDTIPVIKAPSWKDKEVAKDSRNDIKTGRKTRSKG